MATQFDPTQYFLGSGLGVGRFNQPYRPKIQDILARMNRPDITGMPGQGVYIDQMSNPQYVSRTGPDIFYQKRRDPLEANLYPNVPGMGFAPSEGLISPPMMDEPFYPLSTAEAQAAPQSAPMSEPPLETMEQGAAPRRTLGLLGDMFGGASALDEYMTPEQRAQLQNQGLMAAAMQLLASSGPSRVPVGLGQALGQAYGAGQQGYTAAQQNLLQSMTMKQKMDEAKREVAAQEAYQRLLIGGGEAGAQPAGQVVPVVEGAAMPVAAAAAPTGLASLTKEQRMILSRLPAKEGYKEALRLMEQKTESVPDDIKKLKALNLPVTLDNLLKLNPSATPQDPEGIRTLRALNLPVTLDNLQSLKEEASPVEVRILKATGTPVTLENVMRLRQSGAAQTSVKVDTGEKVRVGEINKDITEEMRNVTAQARSANETLMNVDRILPALDKAITGPLADYRTTLTRVGQQFGVVGKDANEVLANTQTLVQGLAQQELAAAGQMRGQGAITEAERALLRRAAAGDQNMSAAELRSALQTAQKTAQYRITQHQQYLSDFSRLPGNEPYMPFYTVKPYQSTGGGNAAQSAIDAELAKRAQQQRGGGMR
jgi:hypothetical protein